MSERLYTLVVEVVASSEEGAVMAAERGDWEDYRIASIKEVPY